MVRIDVIVVAALKLEHDQARDVAMYSEARGVGVRTWERCDNDSNTPYLRGEYALPSGGSFNIALARPTHMGAAATLPLATTLVERLHPRCLAMCGVCAGNPSDVALGDVIIGEMTYFYDEGKTKPDGFQGDHRQTPMLESWVRAAQEMSSNGLPSFGPASGEEPKYWLLERLFAGDDPRQHPARSRYFPGNTWRDRVKGYAESGLVRRTGTTLELTDEGRALVEEYVLLEVNGPQQLPFDIKVGPIASGHVVVKDGVAWTNLAQWGVRSVLGLDMEGASIGALAHRYNISEWVVAKGVMDHADPRKEDRYKAFAARASAEVLFAFLAGQFAKTGSVPRTDVTTRIGPSPANIVADAPAHGIPALTSQHPLAPTGVSLTPANVDAAGGAVRFKITLEGVLGDLTSIEINEILESLRRISADASLSISAIWAGSIVVNCETTQRAAIERAHLTGSLRHIYGFRILHFQRSKLAEGDTKVGDTQLQLHNLVLDEIAQPSAHTNEGKDLSTIPLDRIRTLVDRGELTADIADEVRAFFLDRKYQHPLHQLWRGVRLAAKVRLQRMKTFLEEDFAHHILWHSHPSDNGNILAAIAVTAPDFDYEYRVFAEAAQSFNIAMTSREKSLRAQTEAMTDGERIKIVPLRDFVEVLKFRANELDRVSRGSGVVEWLWPPSWDTIHFNGPVRGGTFRNTEMRADRDRLDRAIRRYEEEVGYVPAPPEREEHE